VIEERAVRSGAFGNSAMDPVKEVKRASLPRDVALITATVPRERVVRRRRRRRSIQAVEGSVCAAQADV